MIHYSINDIKLVELSHYRENNGDLTVIEGLTNTPFSIARVFLVRADTDSIRGLHAHKVCAQFLTCSSGGIEVFCDDGTNTVRFMLNHPKLGLYLPPGIWAQQTYLQPNSILSVLCDHAYDALDYIRDYQQFKNYRKEWSNKSENVLGS
jgi:dTDP-4-dehydrorhamnose 3,5-epimerase-like enzyme